MVTSTSNSPSKLRCSTRIKKSVDRYGDHLDTKGEWHYIQQNYINMIKDFGLLDANDAYLISGDNNFTSKPSCTINLLHETCTFMKCFHTDSDPIQYQTPHPFAFVAKTRNDDSPNFREAMESHDREGFLVAMQSEYESLINLDAWNVVPRDKTLKAHKRIFVST